MMISLSKVRTKAKLSSHLLYIKPIREANLRLPPPGPPTDVPCSESVPGVTKTPSVIDS